MKLIDILVSKDADYFGVNTKYVAMDPDGRVFGYTDKP